MSCISHSAIVPIHILVPPQNGQDSSLSISCLGRGQTKHLSSICKSIIKILRQISSALRTKINRNILLDWTIAGCMFHNKSNNIIVTTIWAIFAINFLFQNLNHFLNQYQVFSPVAIYYHTFAYLSITFYIFYSSKDSVR